MSRLRHSNVWAPKKDPADSAAEIAATFAGLEGCPEHDTDRAPKWRTAAGGWLTVRSREVPRHWRPLANSPRRVRGDRPGRPFAERPRTIAAGGGGRAPRCICARGETDP